ncbi:MAG: translocation/assembly module TamB domain-containing protein [Rhizobiales bacterium]|nr:translocation/assembly module TamB domain-containing protein [Hyphomicrobiales bacterium]MBO6698581.1 translocation/assembly module TamB domain-containing protein [Hyphomicrobiales bacterium]MBO6735166.1 translocation/assembly module TamB domain-containing protein [Hyphomicrobiales bacterium]MBO6911027.1 translocation/assembly module TamB domain-containing protein [Hyphomicrobiales bacterium]MBO6956462.1 translocation/assembly module TamB domain-containing protein [Hyphomicrobiales bacterium
MARRLSLFAVLAVLALSAAFLALPVRGQNDEAQERSRFLTFVEEQLSAPGREIRITGIDGALSSNASIAEITIADEEGVWLRLTDAQIVWDRSALFRARLDIESLSAETIDWPRMPLPQDRPPSPEATALELPDLPVAVNIDRLAIGEASLGEPLFGLAATLTGEGSIALADGSLDTSFDVTRLDGPGGSLTLAAAYEERSTELTLDFQLQEPADGVVANLLNLEGRPPVDLSLTGNGPLDDLTVDLALNTDAGRVLGGGLRLQEVDGGRSFNADLSGPISALIAPAYRGFFGADSTLVASGTLPSEGGFQLDRLDLESGTLSLQASAATAPDGFLTALDLNASFAAETGASVLLPVPGEATRARAGALEVAYGGNNGDWQAAFGLDDLSTDALGIETVRFDLNGQSANLADAARRALSFQGSGEATGFSAADTALVEALGRQIALRLAGDWQAGNPVALDGLRVDGDAFTLAANGAIDTGVFDGQIVLDARTLAPFSGLAARDLGGAMQLVAQGTLNALTGGFDLDLDGTGNALQVGDDVADRLLAGQTRITGGLKRDADGTEARELRIRNNQLALRLDGMLSSTAADLVLQAELDDLRQINPGASGAANLNATVEGESGPYALSATLAVPAGRVYEQALREATITLSGLLDEEIFSGSLTGTGQFGSAPIDLSAELVAGPEERQVTGLRLDTQGATLTGDVRQTVETGLLNGALALNATNIRTLALLALQDASGAVNADVTLQPAADGQAVALTGSASDAAFGDARLGAARFDVAVRDAFGTPEITGTLNGQRLRAGEIAVASLQATSQASGAFTVAADGISAPQLRAAGLSSAQLRANGRYASNVIELASATLNAGQGIEATASGRIPLSGSGLNVDVRGSLPLGFAERFATDRGTQLSGVGTVNATARGSLADPQITGSIAVSGGQVVDPSTGIRLTDVTLAARLDGQRAVIERASAQVRGGGAINASGTVGLGDGLPADLRIGLNGVRYADGTLIVTTFDGDLTISGPLARAPQLAGTINVRETEIQIPSSFDSTAGLIDVEHIAPSDRVRATFERARGADSGGANRQSSVALGLNVLVSAPNQIYVRGRGVNAELGGQVRLTGTTNNVQPVGAFELLRGRFDILGQRIALGEGSITLVGDMDAFLNIVARTTGDAISVVIAVRGRISDPTLTLSSEPELPQDEVLARLIFDRGLNELSPLQIAQLALAANELAGNAQGSVLGSLRDGLGLSDLDVVTDDEGNPAVRATQYVQENVYVGVEASTAGQARTTINLDITEDLTARGSVGSDGESSLGIFFERDY